MDYPNLPMPAAVEAEKFFCPFECKGTECDERGYCAHLVGFTTDRQTVEPLEELLVHSDKKDKWLTTGHLTVNGAHLEKLQPEDKLINPIVRDKDFKTGMEFDKYSWISWRVYTNNPDRVPIMIEKPVKIGPRAVDGKFELKARADRLEQQLQAPAPDDDMEVNPRKANRKKSNEKAHAETVATLERTVKKNRISTGQTKEDSAPEETVEPVT